MNAWERLCRDHYSAAAALSPRLANMPDEAEHRAWLCGSDVTGSRYVAGFASGPMRTWPIREVHRGGGAAGWGGAVRLIALCDPGRPASDMLVGERFVCEKVAPCLDRTCALLRAATSSDPEIVVTYVDSATRRSMQDRTDVVGPDAVNGGVTYHLGGQRKRVIVYRREDACKVLVHELVHAFGLDAALWASPAALEADRAFAKRHRVSAIDAAKPLGLGEAYTESLATYLHAHWWARREAAPTGGVAATLGRVTAHVEDVGRRVDALCSDGGKREFLERTHAFAYAVCRAAIWSTGELPEMLERWPPGSPPKDPKAFAEFLDRAIQRWDRGGALKRSGVLPRGLMMTPLQ